MSMDLPNTDPDLRDVLYLVKNGMALSDALALSGADRVRCARAFAELDHLILVPEDGMRWKSAELCEKSHPSPSIAISNVHAALDFPTFEADWRACPA